MQPLFACFLFRHRYAWGNSFNILCYGTDSDVKRQVWNPRTNKSTYSSILPKTPIPSIWRGKAFFIYFSFPPQSRQVRNASPNFSLNEAPSQYSQTQPQAVHLNAAYKSVTRGTLGLFIMSPHS